MITLNWNSKTKVKTRKQEKYGKFVLTYQKKNHLKDGKYTDKIHC